MDDNNNKYEDEDDNITNSSTTSKPYIVSCGQRHVLIPKSGHEFPAFLVSIPIPIILQQSKSSRHRSNIDDDHDGIKDDNDERKQEEEEEEERRILVWRSKRDFLLLGRCCRGGYSTSTFTTTSSLQQQQQQHYHHHRQQQQQQQHNEEEEEEAEQNSQPKKKKTKKIPLSVSFPKSSYRKLVEKAPWIRPSSISISTLTDATMTTTTTEGAVVAVLGTNTTSGNKDQDTKNTTTNFNNTNNNYHPSMKKSIYQLDQFLLSCQRQYYEYKYYDNEQQHQQQPGLTQEQNPWEIFCRPYDTEDLVVVNDNNIIDNTKGTSIIDVFEEENDERNDHISSRNNNRNNKNNNKRCKTSHVDDDDDDETKRKNEQQHQQKQQKGNSITNNEQEQEREQEKQRKLRISSKLGQYFCSKENAKQVVKMALNTIPTKHILSSFITQQQEQQYQTQTTKDEEKEEEEEEEEEKVVVVEGNEEKGDDNSTRNDKDDEDDHRGSAAICTKKYKLVFIEASCGYGDVIVELIKELDKRNISNNNNNNHGSGIGNHGDITIYGFDIDTTAIRKCKERFSSNSSSIGDTPTNTPTTTTTTTTTTSGCINDYAKEHTKKTNHKNNGDHDDDENQKIKDLAKYYNVQFTCQNFLETSFADYDDTTESKLNEIATIIVCLGGPPYTSGSGSGTNMRRDLPEQFIAHCITKWNASTICFLLPSRYKTFDPTTLVHGYPSPPIPSPSQLSTQSSSLEDSWIVKNVELQSSEFYFQGSVPVIQPSIIQCMWHQNRELS